MLYHWLNDTFDDSEEHEKHIVFKEILAKYLGSDSKADSWGKQVLGNLKALATVF